MTTTTTITPTSKLSAAALRKLRGFDAIEAAERGEVILAKYADPVDGARTSITVDEARFVAAEDPSLIYVSAVVPAEKSWLLTCLRCDGEHFNELRLLSEEDDDIVRREVQCSACSLTGILVAPRVEDEDADGFVGEWETQ